MSAAEVRFERLARAEPLETAQKATVEVMDAQPLVEGWTRQMDADPCQLCTWWWRTGRIWPKNHPFQSHKGCNCQPKVVLAKEIQSTEYTRKLEEPSMSDETTTEATTVDTAADQTSPPVDSPGDDQGGSAPQQHEPDTFPAPTSRSCARRTAATGNAPHRQTPTPNDCTGW